MLLNRTVKSFISAFSILVIALLACSNTKKEVNYEVRFIDATELRDLTDSRVNLWNDYDTREKIVARLYHNEKVYLHKISGDGANIETESGVNGWLNKNFLSKVKLEDL